MNNKKINIEVEVQDAQLIIGALRELPYKFVCDLIVNVVNQVNAQIKNNQDISD